MNVSGSIRTSSTAGHSRESQENRRFLARMCEERSTRQVRPITVTLKVAVGGGTSRVNCSFGDLRPVSLYIAWVTLTYSLMIEPHDLLSKDEVFQQTRPSITGPECTLVLYRHAGIACQKCVIVVVDELLQELLR